MIRRWNRPRLRMLPSLRLLTEKPGLRVRDLMTRLPISVVPHTASAAAAVLLERHNIHHLPVVERARLEGILCSCDLRDAAADPYVADVMTLRPSTIESLRPAGDAAEMMIGLGVGCLPVVDDERLVGILTRGDLRRSGLVDWESFLACASCGTRHHLRTDGRTSTVFCIECLERARPFDDQDPCDELGESG